MPDRQHDMPAAPPKVAATSSAKRILWLALGLPALIGLVVLFWFDPSNHGFYPVCLFHQVTGYDCPGCGGLRACHQLLRGDVVGAFQLNPLIVLMLPVVLVLVLRTLYLKPESRATGANRSLAWAWLLVVVFVGFAVVRNLPIWPFGPTGF